MVHIQFINPLIQFEKKNFDLIITDDENRFPPFRIGKKYPQNATLIQMAVDLKTTFLNYLNDIGSSLTWNDIKGSQFTLDKKGGTKDIFTLT